MWFTAVAHQDTWRLSTAIQNRAQRPQPECNPLSTDMASTPPSSTTMATLAKLTSLSTQTLSLLLERQRLQMISAGPNAASLHLPQITRNLQQLRAGVLDLEAKEGRTEAVKLLRSQYERMRSMLGSEGDTIQRCVSRPLTSAPADRSSRLVYWTRPRHLSLRVLRPRRRHSRV